jgi:hypothetical protein
MLDIMGHMSAKMLQRYSPIRVKARGEAIAAIESREVGVSHEFPKVTGRESLGSGVTH